MARWEVWRQDDNGNQYKVAGYDDRLAALARVAALEAGVAHKQTYWVAGPPDRVCRTNRDLYVRLLAEGRRMTESGRTLDEFLRAWWLVSRPMAAREWLEPDIVAASIVAASTVPPPPLEPDWRTRSFPPIEEPTGYADWEAVVLSQVADLADLADRGPLDKFASFGLDVPRPDGCRRATDRRWYNFEVRSYLECGMAGSLGGWDEDDGVRVPVPGPVVPLVPEPDPGEREIEPLSWADLACLAIYGQEYE